MRILIKNPKIFFEEILRKEKKSLKEISKILRVNYSPMKKYARGELLIPIKIFQKVIGMSQNKRYWKRMIEIKEDNWGQIKAGKISNKKNDSKKRMENARKFKKISRINIKLNKFFCEFYGALLGDGCISKYKDSEGWERFSIYISGNKKLDSSYLKYIKESIMKEYKIGCCYYEYKNKNSCMLHIKNKGFVIKLIKHLDIPIGIKYSKLKVSKKILQLPWNKKKFVLRGLFDTDGSIYAKKSEKYRYPIISIASKNQKFIEQLKLMLKEKGYPAWSTKRNVYVRGIKATKEWFKDIGSSNQRNIKKYEYYLKHKNLPPNILGL